MNRLITFLLTILPLTALSQDQSPLSSQKKIRPLSINLSMVMIDDDNSYTGNVFDWSNWSTTNVPSKLSVSTYFNENLSLEASGGFASLFHNTERYKSPFRYEFFDVNLKLGANLKYSTSGLSRDKKKVVSLYLIGGTGIQHISTLVEKTNQSLNIGFGIDVFILENFLSINAQSLGKFGVNYKEDSSRGNVILHTAGISFHNGGIWRKFRDKKKKKVVDY
ncbi:hypothetical protein EBU94_09380 [bacterium]|nr:hypothetical protein [bacterium]